MNLFILIFDWNSITAVLSIGMDLLLNEPTKVKMHIKKKTKKEKQQQLLQLLQRTTTTNNNNDNNNLF